MPEFIQQLDELILFYIQEHIKSPMLDRSMVFITSLGDAGLIWFAIALLLLLIKRYQKCGISLICAVSFAMLLGDRIIKPLVGRPRPFHRFPELMPLIPKPGSYSFPSGHTMTAFAAATVLYYYDRRLGMAGYILSFLIAFSRVYLMVHYPSDILGGILFGILTSAALIQGINKIYQTLEYHSSTSS